MLENEPGTGTEGGLKRWLEGIGLSHYTDLFAQHRLDLDVMADLTESDLVELGLPLGDRKRLQRAMTALFRAETAEKPDAAARPQIRTEVGAERRQLTTMFCDMVDSTSLSVMYWLIYFTAVIGSLLFQIIFIFSYRVVKLYCLLK